LNESFILMGKEICCLCGLKMAETRDHLFPKCLFNTPRPTNLPTIPACKECNQKLSKDEEDFRVFLAAGMAHENPAGKRIWVEKIRPDLQGKRKGLKNRISSSVKKVPLISQSGDTIGFIPILEINRGVVNRVLIKIAKGLYYLDVKMMLPDEVEILVGYYDENPKIIAPPLDDVIKNAKKIELGNGEVTYWRNIVKDKPEESLTWIRFYKDKIFLICTSKEKPISSR
jgi:hypothetical protein